MTSARSTAQATSPRPDDPQRRPQWINNLLLPLAVGGVGLLVAAVLTPLGDAMREVVSPTKATVSGNLELNGGPLGQATVRVEGQQTISDNAGRFQLTEVGAGEHTLSVQAPAARPREYPFTVTKAAKTVDLGVVKIEPVALLGYFASVKPPTSTGQRKVKYDVTLWLAGADDALGQVRSVAYGLPAPLPAAQVVGGSLQQAFCYRLRGSVAFEDLMVLGGAFAEVTAKVQLADGRTFAMSAGPGAQQPVDCKASTKVDPDDGSWSGPVGEPTIPRDPQLQLVPIPQVVGLSKDDAVAELKRFKFRTEVDEEASKEIAEGLVIRTRPAANSSARRGTVVTVVVSLADQKTVPDVVGKSQATATANLQSLRFNVEVERYPNTVDGVEPGSVVKQDPAGGTSAEPKSTVVIYVAEETDGDREDRQ